MGGGSQRRYRGRYNGRDSPKYVYIEGQVTVVIGNKRLLYRNINRSTREIFSRNRRRVQEML